MIRFGALFAVASLVAAPAAAEPAMQEGLGVEQRLLDAEQIFHSAQQPSSIELFSRILDELELPAAAGVPGVEDEAARALWTRALSYRAQAYFNVGDAEAARADVRRLLTAVPEIEFDAALVSPKFIELVEDLRAVLVGHLEILADPPDADVRIDGRPVQPHSGTVALAAGAHVVTANRPGYSAFRQDVEVPGGAVRTLQIAVPRVSAVVRITTAPAGAAVRIDGEPAGRTTDGGQPGAMGQLSVDGLTPGGHVIEVEAEGYRSHRATVQVQALADYALDPIVLERTGGSVVLRGLTRGVAVEVNGSPVSIAMPAGGTPATPGSAEAVLQLPPGDHRLVVDGGARGLFSADVSLADRQRLTLDVTLRPGLAFLGVLGGDAVGASTLADVLEHTNAAQDLWAWLERSDEAARLLRQASIGAPAFREAPAEGDGSPAGVDFAALQRQLRDAVPASLYLLAVLSDDLVATHADLWFWAAPPAPPHPDRLRVPIEPAAAEAAIGAALTGYADFVRPWFGALLVDVEAAAGPVAFDVTPGSPAAAAGLQVGDEVVELAGEPLTAARQLPERVRSRTPGERVSVGIRRGEQTIEATVALGQTPLVVPPGRGRLGSAIWVAADAQPPGEGPAPWVLDLNRAGVLLHAGRWEEGVRLLRAVDVPEGPGVGRGTRDYWLGLALAALGPDYAELAVDALTRAAEDTGARLEHLDGPLVWPLARARLEQLRSR